MMLLTLFTSLLAGVSTATAASVKRGGGGSSSYCPSSGYISDSDRLSLFTAFTAEIFDAANNNNAGEVAAAFATYISPDLIEHTASAASYSDDVGFLTALLPGTNLAMVGGLLGCFYNTKNQPICTVHYAAYPDDASSLITNVTAISDYYRYDGSCIVEHWDSTMTANAMTTNPNFPGAP